MPYLDGGAGTPGRALARAAAAELAHLRRIGGPGRRTARRIERARLALAVGLVASGLPGAAAARTPLFVNMNRPFGLSDVGSHSSPGFADLDGDGDLDAFVGELGGGVLYFVNTGTRGLPAFQPPVANPFGLAVAALAAPAFGDIDTDGDLDVFVGAAEGDTTFFFNTGTASAPAFQAIPGAAQGLADVGFDAAPALADLDGDADLDAFIGEGEFGNVVYFENVGTPTSNVFGPPVTNPFGLTTVGVDASPRFADLDGDGDLDALIGREGGGFLYFANTGTAQDPAFATAVTNPFRLSNVGSLTAPAFADLDEDGDLDLLAGTFSGETVLFANEGDARTPSFLGPLSLGDVGNYASPTFGDVDGDGDFDALLGSSVDGIFFASNTGTATAPDFAPPVANPFGLVIEVGLPHLSTPDLGDLDGDGDLDVIVGTVSNGIFVATNAGSANNAAFGAPVPPGLAVPNRASPTLADLDGDGDLDVTNGDLGGQLTYFANTGTAASPAFAAGATGAFGLPGIDSAASPSFVDVDRDGDLDVFAGENLGSVIFAENVGTPAVPSFAIAVTNPFGFADVGSGSNPTFADVDADGDPDAFVGVNDGTTAFFANLTPVCPTAPEAGCAAFAAGSVSIDERKSGNEKLVLKLAKGPELAQTAFGDPTRAGGSDFGVCLYDAFGTRVATLAVERAGDACGAKPCWKPLGKAPPDGKGFAYKDPEGASDGVRSIRLAGGADGRSSLAAAASNRAKKGEAAMPAGIALALAASPQVTVQVHGPSACFEAVLDDVTKQEPDRFKAR